MADATNNSSSNSSCNSTTPGSGSGEPIPQWKKELLQRRKNLAKTIGTAATQVHDSASTVAAALTTTPTTPRVGGGPSGGNPFGSLGGQKGMVIIFDVFIMCLSIRVSFKAPHPQHLCT